ncbi:MAG: hypothetical protein JRK53_09840 [Deltaproteobacteria bacterium]|nr:hypothetical protein [Deltaproteobacteria bacterium]MBW2285467.1 hypothetical protein [Deltaproteobacteria bacterium]
MTKTTILLDPTAESTPEKRERLARPKELTGLTVGLLDISKARGDVFLDELETQLAEKGLKVRRYQKPTFARTAPVEVQQDISTQCDLVIEALAD